MKKEPSKFDEPFYARTLERCIKAKESGKTIFPLYKLKWRIDFRKFSEGGEEISSSDLLGRAKDLYEFLTISEGIEPFICSFYESPADWYICSV